MSQQILRTAFVGLFLFGFIFGADSSKPIVIAHRGGAALRPENTLAAFRNALKLGVTMLEFDMNVTADGQVVLHHDSKVNGAICQAPPASGIKPGPISLLKLAEIRQFDCGSFARPNSPHFEPSRGEKMPTLDEFLTAMKSSGALLLGETKFPAPGASYAVSADRFIDLVYPILKRHKVEDRFILQSGEYGSLDAMTKKDPKIKICVLGARRFKPDYLGIAGKYKASYLMLRTEDISSAAEVQQLHSASVQVLSGTANSEGEWQKYVELGVAGILTDDPQAVIAYLRKTAR